MTCEHCNSHMSAIMTEGSYRGDPRDETWRFKIRKAGLRMDSDLLTRFFKKLAKFSRNAPADHKETG